MISAFDLAMRTGWAAATHGPNVVGGKVLESGGWLETSGWFDLRKGCGTTWGQRLGSARRMLGTFIKNVVVVEQPQRFKSRDATRVCYGLYSVLCEECARFGIVPVEVNGSTLKKWATGSGRAEKALMLQAAAAKSGKRGLIDHNEGDAILLAAYAREVLGL